MGDPHRRPEGQLSLEYRITKPLEIGDMIYIRYLDHLLFRNSDSDQQTPVMQEAVGWLQAENDCYIRLVVARYQEPQVGDVTRTKATGYVILKSTILEMRRVA